MKNLIASIAIMLITVFTVQSQTCKAYIPYQEGTKLEITSYDKKGKITGIDKQELTKVSESGNTTSFVMHHSNCDKKGEELFNGDLKYKCKDNVFYVDMSGFVNSEQMQAYKDMDVKVTMDEIDIPADLSVGQKLKDGSVKMDISGNSPVNLSFVVNVENRKVEAKESVTTEAGTFDCVKISQDIITKSMMSFKISSVEWYAEGVGVVKTETYRKGKLMGSSKLTKLERP